MLSEALVLISLPTSFPFAGEDAHGHIRALLFIGALIVVAKLAEGVMSRVGLNSIVAFTAAGVLLGPITGVVEITDHIKLFLEIGVFIFFFLIGWTR